MRSIAQAALLLCLVVSAVCVAQTPASQPSAAKQPVDSHVWPRTFTKGQDTVVLYQPQVDSWKDHAKIRFRAAFSVTQGDSNTTEYGVAAVQGDTMIDDTARTVLITHLDVAVRFPNMDEAKAAPLKAIVKDCLPSLNYLDISLDQVISYMHDTASVKKVDVNLAPPPIFYSDVPAILINYIGQPQFKPVGETQVMFAVNTNWELLLDLASGNYYLLVGNSWMTTADPLNGPWTAAGQLPASLGTLPDGANWDNVKKNIPGKPLGTVPKVFTSTQPAELIVTQGGPEYSPVPGTRLMYVSNPTMPLFWDMLEQNFYYLVAGRWFRAGELTGPWSAASTNLPADFAKIPADGPMGFVLSAVPSTQEARDAVMLASIPHKATINIENTTINVTYDQEPKFVPIEGTEMTYAVNTAYQVIGVNGKYYCCHNGVWFVSNSPTGPWAVCTAVPAAIYTIPPTCPVYNCTYVVMYGTTPTTVTYGYTAGYSGEYVAANGAMMFGAGYLLGSAVAYNGYYYLPPCYYSYGCGVYYSYAYGGFYRWGPWWYGPHGGCGWGAYYNPATGAWGRAGYAYGPAGAHWGAQGYNPWTNTYGQHTGGTNGYSSWGHSYVQRGDQWAAAGHETGPGGRSAGYAENSSGQWAEGARGHNGAYVTTGSGNKYASYDGNVYTKSDDGSWQKYVGGNSWTSSNWGGGVQQQSLTQARSNWQGNSYNSDWNSSQWKNDFENSSAADSGRWNQMGLNNDAYSRNTGNYNALTNNAWGGGNNFNNGGNWDRGGNLGGQTYGGGESRWGGGGFRGGGFRR